MLANTTRSTVRCMERDVESEISRGRDNRVEKDHIPEEGNIFSTEFRTDGEASPADMETSHVLGTTINGEKSVLPQTEQGWNGAIRDDRKIELYSQLHNSTNGIILSPEHNDMTGMNEDFNTAAAPDSCMDVFLVETRIMKLLSWVRMLAYLCIAGRTWFTGNKYMLFAAALQTANNKVKLTTYKKVRGKLWSHVPRVTNWGHSTTMVV